MVLALKFTKVLSGGRIGIAAQALGIAAGAYELAVKYSKEREAFGKPISQHQAIAFKLAHMATEIEAARLLVYRAAWMKDQGMDYTLAAAMAKLFAIPNKSDDTYCRSCASARWIWICKRVSRRALDARRQNNTNLRRHI